MNKDILKGKLLEIKGRVKEKWGKLTDDDLCEIEGKNEKLLGLLQKKYGHISDKTNLEYKDSVELADIVSRIREIRTNKKDVMAIEFITRYGKPLLAKNQERQITEEKNGYDTDRYSYSRLSRRTTHCHRRVDFMPESSEQIDTGITGPIRTTIFLRSSLNSL